MTACFWNTATKEFFYGNSHGQIFLLDLEAKKDKSIHESEQKSPRGLEIKTLWMNKKNSLLFIQANTVTIKSLTSKDSMPEVYFSTYT